MTLGEILVRLRADTTHFDAGVARATASLGRISKVANDTGDSFSKPFAILGLIGLAASKAASDFEKAFANVKRVVSEHETDLDHLRRNVLDLSTKIPVAATELAHLTKVGAMMGITGAAALTKFTEVAARLGAASGTTGEEMGEMLAKIAAVNNIPTSQMDKLGSAVVHLAHILPTTHEAILRMVMQMQGMGSVAGLSAQEMIGLAGALSSVGVRVESGGTAMARIALTISQAVDESSKKLQTLAKLSGMSAKEFAEGWKTDKIGTLDEALKGFARLGPAEAKKAMTDLNLQNIRTFTSFASLAKAAGLAKKSVEEVKDAFEKGNAVYDKSNKMFETLSGQWQLFKNRINVVAIDLGTALLPAFKGILIAVGALVEAIGWAARLFSALPMPIQTVIATLGMAIITMKAFGLTFAAVRMSVLALNPALVAFAAGVAGGATTLGGLVAALGFAAAAATAVGLIVYALGSAFMTNTEIGKKMSGMLGELIYKMGLLGEVTDEFAGASEKGFKGRTQAEFEGWIQARARAAQKARDEHAKIQSDPNADFFGGMKEPALNEFERMYEDIRGELDSLGAKHKSVYAGMMQDIDSAINKRLVEASNIKDIAPKALAELQKNLEALRAVQKRDATDQFIQQNMGKDLGAVAREYATLEQAARMAADKGLKYSKEQMVEIGEKAVSLGKDINTGSDALDKYKQAWLDSYIATLKSNAEQERAQRLMQAFSGTVQAAGYRTAEIESEINTLGGAMKFTSSALQQYEQELRAYADEVGGEARDKTIEFADALKRTREEKERLRNGGTLIDGFVFGGKTDEEVERISRHLDEAQEQMRELVKQTNDWGEALGGISEIFDAFGMESLANIFGGAGTARGGAEKIAAELEKAMTVMETGGWLDKIMGLEGAFGGIGNAIKSIDFGSVIGGLASIVSGMKQAVSQGSALERVLGGIAAGASSGQAIGKIFEKFGVADGGLLGAIGGGAIGLVMGAIGAIFDDGPKFEPKSWAPFGSEAGRVYGQAMSEEIAKEIEKIAGDLGIKATDAAYMVLPKIMKESARDARTFAEQALTMLYRIQQGTIPAGQGIKVVGEAFDMIKEAAIEAGGPVDALVVALIQASREVGQMSSNMKEFVREMIGVSIEGINNSFGKLVDTDEKDSEGNTVQRITGGIRIVDERSAADQAAIFSSVFWAAVKERGLIGAVDAMKPGFDALMAQFKLAGMDAQGGPLADVSRMFDLAGNEMFRGAAEGAAGLKQALEGIAAAGYLSEDAFGAFGRTALDAYNQAMGASNDQKQSIMAVMPLLIALKQAHEAYGYELTEEQKNLMAIAEANGLAFPSDPVRELTDAIRLLIDTIRGVPTDISINTHYSQSGTPPPTTDARDIKGPDEHASLGFWSPKLGKDTLIQAHAGEAVAIGPPSDAKWRQGGEITYNPNISIEFSGSNADNLDPYRVAAVVDDVLRKNLGGLATRVREVVQ